AFRHSSFFSPPAPVAFPSAGGRWQRRKEPSGHGGGLPGARLPPVLRCNRASTADGRGQQGTTERERSGWIASAGNGGRRFPPPGQRCPCISSSSPEERKTFPRGNAPVGGSTGKVPTWKRSGRRRRPGTRC